MRQVLFRVSLARPWTFWSPDPATGWPEVGFVWAWLIVVGFWAILEFWKYRRHLTRGIAMTIAGYWLAGIPIGLIAGRILPFQAFPIWGYGFMVMLGFLTAVVTASWRARRFSMTSDSVWDAGIWLLVAGVFGGRLFYLLQYHKEVYRNAHTLGQFLFATVNLTAGGLVLIGALIGGGLGLWAFCRSRKYSMLNVADVFTPSVFIGIGFGRIGCLLNGCCFGDRCELPWAVTFPHRSVTFDVLAGRGFVDPNALTTMPLHPTQIYSSIDGFLLALVTSLLLRERRWQGEVFAWGCVLYSITRFLMEFIRGDEMGQLGTGLTISQLYSLGIAILGLIIIAWHASRRSVAAPTLDRQTVAHS